MSLAGLQAWLTARHGTDSKRFAQHLTSRDRHRPAGTRRVRRLRRRRRRCPRDMLLHAPAYSSGELPAEIEVDGGVTVEIWVPADTRGFDPLRCSYDETVGTTLDVLPASDPAQMSYLDKRWALAAEIVAADHTTMYVECSRAGLDVLLIDRGGVDGASDARLIVKLVVPALLVAGAVLLIVHFRRQRPAPADGQSRETDM